ncbi:MAG: pyruvate ferredoxin oxidoreductase [Candidatus Bathyarchaeia archaeon]
MTILALTGNEAVAYAVKQAKVDVVAAYPITPQTIIVERFSKYVADGEVETEFVCVESEHSAMSACIGASLTGARTFTASASQGLALMHEMLYIASGLRCPIVMAVANRALSAPINIHGDHSDMMGSRDCGWVQIYAENAQEAYDWTIQAFKIAEDTKVSLPVSVNLDGFILTHSTEGVNVQNDEEIASFLPPRKALYTLDPKNPITIGALCFTDYYFEFKRQQEEAMKYVPETLLTVTSEYERLTGRRYGILETFGMEDAEVAVLCLGSTAGTAREVAKNLRKRGEKVGVIKLWLYRPFPINELVNAISELKALAVLDKALSFGAPYGALCNDIAASLHRKRTFVPIINCIYGLGGRDIKPSDIHLIYEELLKTASTGVVEEHVKFVGVRE